MQTAVDQLLGHARQIPLRCDQRSRMFCAAESKCTGMCLSQPAEGIKVREIVSP